MNRDLSDRIVRLYVSQVVTYKSQKSKIIIIKTTTKGVVTDFDGNFKLKVKTGDTLLINYLGYQTKELKISNSNTYTINMTGYDLDILGEVVTIGIMETNTPSLKHRNIRSGNLERTAIGKILYKMTNIFRRKE